MPVDRQYQTYYGIKLDHYENTWGGITYNNILIKEFPSEFLSTASVTTSSPTDVTFMYPSLWKNKYYIDGVAEGHISIYNTSTTSTYYISRYGVELRKTNNVASNQTVLGSYTYTLSSASDIPPEDWLTLPIFINLDRQLVEEDERLLLRIYFYETTNSNECGVAHYNDSNHIDMQIKIPYAYSG